MKWSIRKMRVIERTYDEFGHRQSICEDFLGRQILIYISSMYGDISVTYNHENAAITIGHVLGVRTFTRECWKVKTGIFWRPTHKRR